jgi:hypothetical protein
MSDKFKNSRFWVTFRVDYDKKTVQNAPNMLQQNDILEKTAKTHGGLVVREFLDSEPKVSKDKLTEAINYCKDQGAIFAITNSIVITNNIYHVKYLIDSEVLFCFCDDEDINKYKLLHIYNTLSASLQKVKKDLPIERRLAFEKFNRLKKKHEHYLSIGDEHNERVVRGAMTKLKVGRKTFYTDEGRQLGGIATHDNAISDINNQKAFDVANKMMMEAASLRDIARTLNTSGYKTSRGSKYYASSVSNLLRLYKPKRLRDSEAVIVATINEKLYHEILCDEETYKDIHQNI